MSQNTLKLYIIAQDGFSFPDKSMAATENDQKRSFAKQLSFSSVTMTAGIERFKGKVHVVHFSER